jgi:uncharacterized protein YjiK
MLKKTLITISTILLTCTLLYLTDLDDRLHYLTRSWANTAEQKIQNIWLDRYQQVGDERVLTGVRNNLSGITYCSENQKLYAIINSPTQILELTTNGELLRTIDLKGFEDTEAIVHLDNDRFAVLEERRHTLLIIGIDETTTFIDRKNAFSNLHIDLKERDNLGFEGLAYDSNEQTFYIVNEKTPRQIIAIKGWNGSFLSPQQIHIQVAAQVIKNDIYLDDYSGLHFDQRTGHLLFLSDESKQLNEVSLLGEQISFMDLEQGFSGLVKDIPQAEGVTMDDNGMLYIVSEPNLFYRFEKQ